MTLKERVYGALLEADLNARYSPYPQNEPTAPYLLVLDGGEEQSGKRTRKEYVVVTAFAPSDIQEAFRAMVGSAKGVLSQIESLRGENIDNEETVDDEKRMLTQKLKYSMLRGA